MIQLVLMALAAVAAVGVWGIIVSLVKPDEDEAREAGTVEAVAAVAAKIGRGEGTAKPENQTKPVRFWQYPVAAGAFLGFWWLSGFVGLGVAAAECVIMLPLFWVAAAGHETVIKRDDALVAWMGNIRDLLRNNTVQGSLVLASRVPFGPIAPAVEHMSHNLEAGMAIRPALIRLADDIKSPVCDKMAFALVTAEEEGAPRIMEMMNHLIENAQMEVTGGRETVLARKKALNVSRWLSVMFAGMLAFSALFFGDIMEGYKGVAGQTVLVGVMLLWGSCVFWLYRINRPPPETRTTMTTSEEQDLTVETGDAQ